MKRYWPASLAFAVCCLLNACQNQLPFPHVAHVVQLSEEPIELTLSLPAALDTMYQHQIRGFSTARQQVTLFSSSEHLLSLTDTVKSIPDTLLFLTVIVSEWFDQMPDTTMLRHWTDRQSANNTYTEYHLSEIRTIGDYDVGVVAYDTPHATMTGKIDYIEAFTVVNERGVLLRGTCRNFECDRYMEELSQCLNTLRFDVQWTPDRVN